MALDKLETLSPKEFAEAIGVSESSVKRWADSGLIDVTRTAGGHRRIMVSDAIRFVRKKQMRLVHPERFGLAPTPSAAITAAGREPEGSDLVDHIRRGRSDLVVSLLLAAFIQGSTMADLWDGPISGALDFFGRNWQKEVAGIPMEHEATMTVLDAIGRIKSLLPDPGEDCGLALGGAPEGDPYLLPSLAASAVLAEAGLRVVNLGPNTPLDSFAEASRRYRPDLVWLSMTGERSPGDVQEIQDLLTKLGPVQEVILGGQFALTHRAEWRDHARVLRTMNELALVAETVSKRATQA